MKTEELQKTENALVEELKNQFAGVRSLSTDSACKLLSLLDKAPDAALFALVRERVRFCWMPSVNRLRKRGYKREYILAA